MGLRRIELTGAADTQFANLKALGLMTEIIAWKLRLFVPLGDGCLGVLGRLLERHPPLRLVPRAAEAA